MSHETDPLDMLDQRCTACGVLVYDDRCRGCGRVTPAEQVERPSSGDDLPSIGGY